MTLREWQHLSPADAAHEVHARIRARLTLAQQRAVFAQVAGEAALTAELAQADRKTPLAGVPYFVKDIFPVAGQAMLAGSTFLPEIRPVSVQDSALVQQLRTVGAALAGRTHLHEFAYGVTGENPHYGDCEHPRFPARTTGGSSSGSAAAVAAGIVPLAIGTDTGGSVRVPAAFCGIYGLRLTPHHTWIEDAFALAPSYDTAGWFTATAADMAIVTDALIGLKTDPRPPTGLYLELPGLDPEVAKACAEAATQFAPPADAATRSALLAAFAPSVDTYNTVVAGEAWHVHESWANRYEARYDPAVWQRLNRVHSVTDEQREIAERSTERIKRAWRDYFRAHDFLILPASPFAAPTKPERTAASRLRILSLTAAVSIGGLPVLTIPVPLVGGLSTGIQIVVPTVESPVLAWALEKLSR